MMLKEFSNYLEQLEGSPAFKNYLQVRERVLFMLDEAASRNDRPSDYWKEELAGFEYMLDASPLIIEKLREHCFHLTGLRSGDYRGHHSSQAGIYRKKWEKLKAVDKNGLWVPESPQLGGFGFSVDGQLMNLDTLKFYECLIALEGAGLLSKFRVEAGPRPVVLEIGAGWGGFAYQFKALCPNTTYVIIDLPQTLLFSGTYLKTAFPQTSIFIYGDQSGAGLLKHDQGYDFILLPNYSWNEFNSHLDLAINMVSFQEMTTAQVEGYVNKIAGSGCPYLYSMNRDRSPYNSHISSVSAIIASYFETRNINPLPETYVDLPTSLVKGGAAAIIEDAKTVARRWFLKEEFKYQHLLGTRRKN